MNLNTQARAALDAALSLTTQRHGGAPGVRR